MAFSYLGCLFESDDVGRIRGKPSSIIQIPASRFVSSPLAAPRCGARNDRNWPNAARPLPAFKPQKRSISGDNRKARIRLGTGLRPVRSGLCLLPRTYRGSLPWGVAFTPGVNGVECRQRIHFARRHLRSTAPPACCSAEKPPATWATDVSPMSLSVLAARAERPPEPQ